MKAIQVKQPGGPEALELVDLQIPQPKENEIVVKTAASGVNFIDIYQREGRYKLPLPFVAGQEGSGTVTAVGSKVSGFKLGDRVAWAGIQASYAEYVAVPADRAVPVPSGVDLRTAAAAMLVRLRLERRPKNSTESNKFQSKEIIAGERALSLWGERLWTFSLKIHLNETYLLAGLSVSALAA